MQKNFRLKTLQRTELSNYLHGGPETATLRLYWSGPRTWSAGSTPNSADNLDDDEVNVENPRDYMEDYARRMVLREATTPGPSSISNADRPRTFSPGASHARHRKSLDTGRFRSHSSHGRKPRVSEDEHRAASDPEGHGVLLNNDGNPLASSLPQFRRANTDSGGRGAAMDVVKLMDSKGNSSRNPAWLINLRTPERKPGELSRDSPLFPRGRSSWESEESAEEAIGGNLQPRSDLAEDNEGESGRHRRPSEDKGSYEGNVLTIHPRGETDNFPSGTKQSRRRRDVDNSLTQAKVQVDNESSMAVTAKNSQCVLGNIGRQSVSILHFLPYYIRLPVVGVLRTLGIFVQIGRQIMDAVDSNMALSCTREYLWLKIERWLDT